MKKRLSAREKTAFCMGGIGNELAFMLSSSYVLYYYEDVLHVNAWLLGVILLAARVYDAINDPVMGIVVAKTRSKYGRFRPWILIGGLLNSVILFLLFSAPPHLNARGLSVYGAVIYILWGMTFTMIDIPFWSMIPAFTESGKERETLTALIRSCTGIGIAVISVFTINLVVKLGTAISPEGSSDAVIERYGFRAFAMIVAILFLCTSLTMFFTLKEGSTESAPVISFKDMIRALFTNDQAVTMVVAVVMGNAAIQITSNLLIYFFKYDIARGPGWRNSYTLFNAVGGASMIASMIFIFPLLRKFVSTITIFKTAGLTAISGYILMLILSFAEVKALPAYLVACLLVYVSVGLLNILITLFLANTVDYGELKNGHRDESVIFSMQTLCVKLASGIAALVASICLSFCHLSDDPDAIIVGAVKESSVLGLRLTLSLGPALVLAIALIIFKKHYILTDEKLEEINNQLKARRELSSNTQ